MHVIHNSSSCDEFHHDYFFLPSCEYSIIMLATKNCNFIYLL